jgi:hypothetical protein
MIPESHCPPLTCFGREVTKIDTQCLQHSTSIRNQHPTEAGRSELFHMSGKKCESLDVRLAGLEQYSDVVHCQPQIAAEFLFGRYVFRCCRRHHTEDDAVIHDQPSSLLNKVRTACSQLVQHSFVRRASQNGVAFGECCGESCNI